jgi:hypothetical protein
MNVTQKFKINNRKSIEDFIAPQYKSIEVSPS